MAADTGADGRIATNHGEVAFIDTGGPGPAVVFVHGNSLCKEAFARQIDRFGGPRRVVAVDLPGHGASQNARDPARTYCLAGYAGCIGEVLAGIGAGEAIVVGWSLGGHIGIEMTSSFPGLVGLMAVAAPPFELPADGPPAGFRPHPRLAMSGQEVFTDADAREYVSAFGWDPDASPEWVAAVARADGRARRMMFEGLFLQPPRRQRDLVEAFDGPVALVCGADDPYVDGAYLKEVACRDLWSGEVHLIAGCGHGPFVEAPEETDALITRFLDDVAPSGGAPRRAS